MIITLKNKDTLIIDEFRLKCCIGRGNLKKNKFEKIYRNDYKYNYFILLKYNYINPKKNKGSAIFIHLTKDYKRTAGCVALSKKDFLILTKLINKKSKIIIN